MIPVILSGGSGTRLWPLSRKQRPKQFLPVVDEDNTLLQSTLLRLQGVSHLQPPIIVCNEDHRFMVAEQLHELNLAHQGILLEPVGRNTAPAIVLAALHALKADPDAMMLVLPADHVITDIQRFHIAIDHAEKTAKQGKLVTFGIVPNKAETGYGYIKYNKQDAEIKPLAYKVEQFVEKPDQATAESYLNDGHYLWNSGMFMFQAKNYLDSVAQYEPDILQACQVAIQKAERDIDFIRVDNKSFSSSPNISIDNAIMERSDNIALIPLDAGWNDVGSWPAVWEVGEQDEYGNVVRGNSMLHNANNNLIYTEKRLVALVGVEDLVVVDTKDATLVMHKDRAQDIKKIVQRLIDKNASEAQNHSEVYRPWGCYDCIDVGYRFQVKRITVNPGAKLSLQKHHHRAEHWVVVKGTAEVTCDDKTFLLTENQSTYIPLGSMHRLANPGKIPLEMVEVQSGGYLDEDDIERYDDQYGRSDNDK
ncbi:MAG: mannose-1-phosphate guanylyltransferase/mannose-6-phosphate isomerase [Cocleimonas sp.]|nr:mannose-1-phosphate guanylyltransferase/mannose-6-phosphate isomerase [Cocleimonas sp.]